MIFEDVSLRSAIDEWAIMPDPRQRSCAHNLIMEARASTQRIGAFEAACAPVRNADELRRKATDYYEDYVRVQRAAPHTFQAMNDAAALPVPSPEQKLVRLESIAEPLDKIGLGFDDLARAFERHDRGSNTLVELFIDEWNRRTDIRRNPVSFAAFKEQLLPQLAEPDWPDQLRDHLGLAHFDPVAGPIVVALMEYEVEEVLVDSGGKGLAHMFCAPTALDGSPYAQFVPTPNALPFGCPMALFLAQSDEDLIAEVLHPRLSYRRRHLKRLGVIQRPVSMDDFVALRNNHICTG